MFAFKFRRVSGTSSKNFESKPPTNQPLPSRQPWYIDTGMFEGVKVPIPLLEPNYAVERIIDAVLKDQMVLMMPRWVLLFVF